MVCLRQNGPCKGHHMAFAFSPQLGIRLPHKRTCYVLAMEETFPLECQTQQLPTTLENPSRVGWGRGAAVAGTDNFSYYLSADSDHLGCPCQLRKLQCSLCHAGCLYFSPFHNSGTSLNAFQDSGTHESFTPKDYICVPTQHLTHWVATIQRDKGTFLRSYTQ